MRLIEFPRLERKIQLKFNGEKSPIAQEGNNSLPETMTVSHLNIVEEARLEGKIRLKFNH